MNYKEYSLSWKEIGSVFGVAVIVTGGIGFLFYHSAWSIILYPFFLYFLYRRKKKRGKELQRKALQEQFFNGIRVLNTSLQAGMSVENAWCEVQKETAIMYGKESLFYREVREINHSVALNIPIEKLLLDFAHRSGIEDVIRFAEVFDYGKRSGGNWKKILDTTVFRMQEKQDARKEIEVMIAAKKLEQQVMNLLPLVILLFLQLTSWDYMSVLYHNPIGIIFMTVCLLGYAGAVLLSEKILQIKV